MTWLTGFALSPSSVTTVSLAFSSRAVAAATSLPTIPFGTATIVIPEPMVTVTVAFGATAEVAAGSWAITRPLSASEDGWHRRRAHPLADDDIHRGVPSNLGMAGRPLGDHLLLHLVGRIGAADRIQR